MVVEVQAAYTRGHMDTAQADEAYGSPFRPWHEHDWRTSAWSPASHLDLRSHGISCVIWRCNCMRCDHKFMSVEFVGVSYLGRSESEYVTHLAGLSVNCHVLDQSQRKLRSAWREGVSSWLRMRWNICCRHRHMLSSLVWYCFEGQRTWHAKKMGPRMLPSGTPEATGIHLECFSSTMTRWERCQR